VTSPAFVAPREALVAGGELVLDGPEGRHAATVARVSAGEEVLLVDGAGRRAEAVVTGAGRASLRLTVRAVQDEPPARPRLVVVQALPKGDRAELAVETMTEVGVDVVVPWPAARCVTRWKGDRADRGLARWRAAAVAAGKQSRRARFPEVTAPAGTDQVARLLSSAALSVVLHEDGDAPLTTSLVPADGDVLLVVGPEGGITPDELDRFRSAGAVVRTLGPTVLRTSTAGVVALSVLLARTDRWTGPTGGPDRPVDLTDRWT
jgi:16S rRNA (uracil1498-N3)-methyltransferase